MSLGVQIGLVLALATSVVSLLGFLLKARGANEAPPIEWRRPVSSSLALFRSGWYTLGIVVAMASWGLHVAALALAPISLVQTTIAGGLVLLTVLAERLFGQSVTRREWIGVALTALGLALLAVTIGGAAKSAHAHFTSLNVALDVGLTTLVALAVWRLARPGPAGATLLALSAGLLWGASDVSIKALSGHVGEGVAVLLHPLALVILLLSLVGLLVSAGSLQVGGAVAVIAVTSAAANVVTIAAGPVIFREPLPSGGLAVAVRFLAFVLVVTAAALTPPPAGEPEPA